MEFQDRYELIDRIICGFTICNYKNNIYRIDDPLPEHRLLAEHHYNKIYTEVCNYGVQTEAEILATALDKKLWSEELEKNIRDKQDIILKLKKELPRLEFKSNLRKDVLAKIEILELEIDDLKQAKAKFLNNSVEYIANLERHKYLVFLLGKTVAGERLWHSWDDFKISDNNLVMCLMLEAFFNKNITEPVLRELARTDPWRNIWVAACKTGDLFEKPMTKMTDLQRALVTWSLIYDSAYESMDPPTDEIVANDVLFDAWMEAQSNKRKAERGKRIMQESNAQEIGIPVDSLEDAKKVFDLNDPMAKSILTEREAAIDKSGGVLNVTKLPDQKRNIQMQFNQQKRPGV